MEDGTETNNDVHPELLGCLACGASIWPPHHCDDRRIVLKCPQCGILLRYNAKPPGPAGDEIDGLPPFVAGRYGAGEEDTKMPGGS